jgi:hypothetical protein
VRVGRTLPTISVRAISHDDEEEGMMVAVKQEFEAMNPKRDDKNRGKRDHKQFPHLVTCDSRSRFSFFFLKN